MVTRKSRPTAGSTMTRAAFLSCWPNMSGGESFASKAFEICVNLGWNSSFP